MMITEPKPGTPAEVLEHVGVKGMHWGIRKQRQIGDIATKGLGITTTGSRERSAARASAKAAKTPLTSAQRAHRKQVAKRVAIGVGITATAAGAIYVGYRLNKSGKISLPHQNRHPAVIKGLMEKHGSVKMSKRETQTALKMVKNDLKFQKSVNDVLSRAPRSGTKATAKAVTDAFNKGHRQGILSTRGEVFSKIGPQLEKRR